MLFFKKWAYPGLFLFIFVLFKHKFYRKTVGVSGIRTRIVGVEGKHADHLTTTTAQVVFNVGLVNQGWSHVAILDLAQWLYSWHLEELSYILN